MTEVMPICRACGEAGLMTILSLGRTPLANALLTWEQLFQPEPTYPLDLVFCPGCSLVQITGTVDPEQLFREYPYLSSVSDTVLQNAKGITEDLMASRRLDQTCLVVEIASNDGYLLQYYHQRGIPVLGIEPARNIARVAEMRGIRTICDFFGKALAGQLRGEDRQADVIHANNVLAHVADLNGSVAGIGLLLKDHGVAVIEVPYVKKMIDHVEFDTIYHEHLCYFSVTALARLFRQHRLVLQDVEHTPIHGGSLRLFVGHSSRQTMAVAQALGEEATWGLDKFGFYQPFEKRVEKLKFDLLTLLRDLKAKGKRIAGYGASAKGTTLLSYLGIGRETLEFIVDRSTIKQGLHTPGTHLPIYAPTKLVETMPDYALLLTWNFAEEILAQQTEYRRRGGQFIIPIPQVKIV